MAKSNEEDSLKTLSSNKLNKKPPLKRTKTLPSPFPTSFHHLRVSVDNGTSSSSFSSPPSKSNADFSEEQWNYPSFLGTTTRKRRPSPKPPIPIDLNFSNPHPQNTSLLLPSSSSSSLPSPPITRPQRYNPSPLFYLVSYALFSIFPFPLHTVMPFSYSSNNPSYSIAFLNPRYSIQSFTFDNHPLLLCIYHFILLCFSFLSSNA